MSRTERKSTEKVLDLEREIAKDVEELLQALMRKAFKGELAE